jgi:hypothetical protein
MWCWKVRKKQIIMIRLFSKIYAYCRDISFIYDCVVHRNLSKTNIQPSKYDLSAVRINDSNYDRVSLNLLN